jgi:hypothetical protein
LSKDVGQTRVGRLGVGHGKFGPDTVQLSNAEHLPALTGEMKKNAIKKIQSLSDWNIMTLSCYFEV